MDSQQNTLNIYKYAIRKRGKNNTMANIYDMINTNSKLFAAETTHYICQCNKTDESKNFESQQIKSHKKMGNIYIAISIYKQNISYEINTGNTWSCIDWNMNKNLNSKTAYITTKKQPNNIKCVTLLYKQKTDHLASLLQHQTPDNKMLIIIDTTADPYIRPPLPPHLLAPSSHRPYYTEYIERTRSQWKHTHIHIKHNYDGKSKCKYLVSRPQNPHTYDEHKEIKYII